MEEIVTKPSEDQQLLRSDSSCELQNTINGSGDAGNVPASTNSTEPVGTREIVTKRVQTLMQELEQKREADKQMIEEFRNSLRVMVDEMCQQVEEKLLSKQKETNKQVEAKLQCLNEVVENVSSLEAEMNDFKSAVGVLFNQLHP